MQPQEHVMSDRMVRSVDPANPLLGQAAPPLEQVPSDRMGRSLDPSNPFPRPGHNEHVESAAIVIRQLTADLDEGGLLRFIHGLEQREGPQQVNAFRLIEHLALTAISEYRAATTGR